MRQSLSWIDPADLQSRLRELVPSKPAEPLAQIASLSLASRLPLRSRPAAVETTAAGQAPPFEPPRGTLQERLHAFLDWAGRYLEAEKSFLAGQEGLFLAPASVPQNLVVASTWVVNAWEKASEALGQRSGGWAIFEVPGGAMLVLVFAEGTWGMRGFGAIVRARPDSSVLSTIRRSLLELIRSIETS